MRGATGRRELEVGRVLWEGGRGEEVEGNWRVEGGRGGLVGFGGGGVWGEGEGGRPGQMEGFGCGGEREGLGV